MPSKRRPNLILDEQAFQDLLCAAFTVQEHNDWLNQARQTGISSQVQPEVRAESETSSVCQRCGAQKPDEQSRCRNCGQEEFRPGERMQRKWASMWLMSQEQTLWPERPTGASEVSHHVEEAPQKTREVAQKQTAPLEAERRPQVRSVNEFPANGSHAAPVASNTTPSAPHNPAPTETVPDESAWNEAARDETASNQHRFASESVDNHATYDTPAAEREWTIDSPGLPDFVRQDFAEPAPAAGASELALEPFAPSASDDFFSVDAAETDTAMTDRPMTAPVMAEEMTDNASSDAHPTSTSTSLRQRFADLRVTLRFHRANLYLGAAVFMAALALMWPEVSAPQRSSLGPMERALVALGIADAPTPEVHTKGDPTINVWVDPHTALYYCPGEDQYGKTPDGSVSTQHEAQMDAFQPAGRSPCE